MTSPPDRDDLLDRGFVLGIRTAIQSAIKAESKWMERRHEEAAMAIRELVVVLKKMAEDPGDSDAVPTAESLRLISESMRDRGAYRSRVLSATKRAVSVCETEARRGGFEVKYRISKGKAADPEPSSVVDSLRGLGYAVKPVDGPGDDGAGTYRISWSREE